MHPLAAWGTASQAGHVRFGPRLVEEDKPGRVEPKLAAPPRAPRPRNVGTILFAGPKRLFFKVSPILSKTT
jgi:hypothetical protein